MERLQRNRFALLAVFWLLAASLPAQPQIRTIRLICLPNVPLPVVLGQAQGIFARFGVKVVAEKATSAAALREALATHQADLAHASVENAVAGSVSGEADYVIVMGGEGSTSELIVQPDIHTIEDLRGHILILDGENTAYTLLLRRILERHGLKPGVDCTLQVVGLAPQRLQAMRDHPEYAATIQKPPTSLLSERAGLHSLGSTNDLSGLGRMQGIGAFTVRSWANDHADLLEHYIAAFIVAQRWMMDPANKQAVIDAMMKESHMPQDIAEQTYTLALKNAWTPDARFDEKGFRNVLTLDAGNAAPASASRYYEPIWYRRGLKLVSQSKP